MSPINTFMIAFQVDIATIPWVVIVDKFALLRVITDSLTNGSILTATEYLEDIAFIQIDGGTTPYLRFFTIATAKHVQCLTQHIHTLFVEDDT